MSKIGILLSYPRSGNTWLRYCIEFITKQPTGFKDLGIIEHAIFDQPLGQIVDIGVNVNKKIILQKSHGVKGLIGHNGTLLFLIRNYKECILRHTETTKKIHDIDEVKKMISYTFTGLNSYMDLLKYYDKYEHKKHIVYYEDIIGDNLENNLIKIIQFLGFYNNNAKSNLDELIQNLPKHKKQAIKIYNMNAKSRTKGKKEIFHSYKISYENRCLWDKSVEQNSPDLFNKYLLRYK